MIEALDIIMIYFIGLIFNEVRKWCKCVHKYYMKQLSQASHQLKQPLPT